MRLDIIDYFQTLNLGTFIPSTELPWSENGTPLYLKNLKKIYVDVDQYVVTPLITTLNGINITEDITAVRIFFANDAKSVPPNYEEVVQLIRSAKDIDAAVGYSRREVDVTTSFEADKLVTEIEIRFIKLT